MALVEKPLCRNSSGISNAQIVNGRLPIPWPAGEPNGGLLFHCPWLRPLLGAQRMAQQYAPKDMFD